MKHFLLLIGFLSTLSLTAQNTGELVIFSNLGEKFYVILNGIQQNQTPESHVKIEGLAEGWYSCRVQSENNLFSLTQNVGVGNNIRATYHVINKKGVHKLRYYSESPINGANTNENISTVVYHTEPLPSTTVTETTTTTTQTTTTHGTSGSSTSSQTGTNGSVNTSTTVGGGTTGTNETVNVNVGMTGTGVSTQIEDHTTGTTETVNVTIGMTGTGISTEIEEETFGDFDENVNVDITMTGTGVTTTTETNETVGVNVGMSGTGVTTSGNGANTTYNETTTYTTTTTTTTSTSQNGSVTSQPTNTLDYSTCIVDNDGMVKVLGMVKSESFSENKMRVAKQFSKNKCLTVDQIRQIAQLFSFSEDIMEYVKFAYPNCMNKDDYYELMEVFTFSGDKEELERFLDAQ